MRFSRQRQQVYDILRSTTTHPDAAWVYAKMREVMPNVSLGTVYRNLSELCDAGLVKRISAVGNVERFDADMSQHAHFVCDCCGCIKDIPTRDFSVQCDYDGIEKIELMAYGVCQDCKRIKEVK